MQTSIRIASTFPWTCPHFHKMHVIYPLSHGIVYVTSTHGNESHLKFWGNDLVGFFPPICAPCMEWGFNNEAFGGLLRHFPYHPPMYMGMVYLHIWLKKKNGIHVG